MTACSSKTRASSSNKRLESPILQSKKTCFRTQLNQLTESTQNQKGEAMSTPKNNMMFGEYMLRDYKEEDAEKMRDMRVEYNRLEAENLDPERRMMMRIATAGLVGSHLSDPGKYYAAQPNRLFIACPTQNQDIPVAYCAMVHLDEDEVEIHDIVQDPEFIGEGLSHKLMEAAEQYARENGYKRIMIWNYRHQERERRNYERRGYWYAPSKPDADTLITMKPVRMCLEIRR